jgi:hypothetical protein
MDGHGREAEDSSSTFLVEHYWPGVTETDFAAAAERVRRSAEALASDGQRIRYLHSTLVPEDEAAFCVLEAESRELVRAAYAEAGVRHERILDAVESGPTGPPRRRSSEKPRAGNGAQGATT